MKKIAVSFFAMQSMLVFAAPQVVPESVSFTQDPHSRKVAITYMLKNEPAIVTVDIQTNAAPNNGGSWVSIGGTNLRHLSGDVNKVVEKLEETCTVSWIPHKTWEGFQFENGIRAVVSAWSVAAPPDYMVVSLAVKGNVRYYANADSLPYPLSDARYRKEEIVLRKVPAAGVRWRMGHSREENENPSEIPHYVTLTSDYYIGVFEVTADQWFSVKGTYPAKFTPSEEVDSGSYPLANVTYQEVRGNPAAGSGWNWPKDGHELSAVSFLGKLRSFTGVMFDLPTEAQWEYACRAGTGTAQYNGNPAKITDIAWMAENAGGHAHPVGLLDENNWGLYDMLGNVREWCLDWYSEGQAYSDGSDVSDPEGARESTGTKVRRGESFAIAVTNVRAARRSGFDPVSCHESIGLRVVCPISGN